MQPRRQPGAPYRLVGFCVLWAIVPTALIIGYSFITPIYSPRYLAYATPAVALLIGAAIDALSRRTVVAAVTIAMMMVLALPVYLSQRTPYAKKASDWAAAAGVLESRAQPGDPVIYTVLANKVGVTTGKLAIAYPRDVSDLRDITMMRTPAASASLWGRRAPLASVIDRLNGAHTVFVITDARRPLGDQTNVERPLLKGLGYRTIFQWRGPSTIVYELRLDPDRAQCGAAAAC